MVDVVGGHVGQGAATGVFELHSACHKHGPGGAERWADYLDWVREDIIEGVLGLQLLARTASRLPSGWSPLELLSHLRHMEQRWFVWGFLGEQVLNPWGDWNVDDPSVDSGPAGMTPAWRVADGVAAEDIATALRDIGQRTREVPSTHDLGERARLGADSPNTLPTFGDELLVDRVGDSALETAQRLLGRLPRRSLAAVDGTAFGVEPQLRDRGAVDQVVDPAVAGS